MISLQDKIYCKCLTQPSLFNVLFWIVHTFHLVLGECGSVKMKSLFDFDIYGGEWSCSLEL